MADIRVPPRSKINQTPDGPGGQAESVEKSIGMSKMNSPSVQGSEDQESGSNPGDDQNDPQNEVEAPEDPSKENDPQEIADDVSEGLSKLNALFSASSQVSPEENQLIQEIMSKFSDLIKGMSGDESVNDSEQYQGDQGNVPMESGSQKVQPANF